MSPAHGDSSPVYSRPHRFVEITAIVLFLGLSAYQLIRILAVATGDNIALFIIAAAAGYIAADFMSGFVHWLFDTWGEIDTPGFGENFIRPFREHHTDEKAITRHDFIETNGNNCVASIPVLLGGLLISPDSALGLFLLSFLVFTSLAVLATNQIHKWAHVDSPPGFIRWLQKHRLILDPGHHRIHHEAPFATHYCITTGWLNPLLGSVDFYRRLEHTITVVTGVKPRKE